MATRTSETWWRAKKVEYIVHRRWLVSDDAEDNLKQIKRASCLA